MIVRDAPEGGLLLIRQDHHAHLTEPWARAWKWDVPRREETARACGLHDDGWAEWDDAPRVDAFGNPHAYRDMPADDYRALWARGFARAWDAGAWIGLLVSLHGARFFEWKKERAEDARVLDAERARERAALAELGYTGAAPPDPLPRDVATGFALLRYLDGLSLFVCEHWDAPWTTDVPAAEGGKVAVTADRARDGTVTLDPWPFTVDAFDVQVEAARTARRKWPDDAAYRADFAAAERVTLRWRLAPVGAVEA